MKVGDYVRTKNGYIGKVEKSMHPSKSYEIAIHYKADKFSEMKYSSNIIDLIEVGDYVNGHRVVEVDLDDIDDYGNNFRYIKTEHDFTLNHWVKENEIKSIVTKEQFESMEYKVGE